MNQNQLTTFAQLEADLWEAADQLRANSKLTSSEYCMPVLGVIFLRHATNRFEAATRQIEADQAIGRMPKRRLIKDDYVKRCALYLPEEARYDWIMSLPKEEDLDLALVNAMTAIEKEFEPLKGVLPKEYAIFDRIVLEDLLRIFNREVLRTAGGDVFGRIDEYFLMKFAMQGRRITANSSHRRRWCRPSSMSSSLTTASCSTPPAAPPACSVSPATSSKASARIRPTASPSSDRGKRLPLSGSPR